MATLLTSLPKGYIALNPDLVFRARTEKQLSMEDAAGEAEIDIKTWRSIEAGNVGLISKAQKMAAVLGIENVNDLRAAVKGKTVVVHGWPGVGKTTFVSRLTRAPHIRTVFPTILWTSLGQTPNLTAELSTWLHSIQGHLPDPNLNVQQLRKILNDRLQDTRALIVIDDVWNAEDARTMSVGGPHCSVLVTARGLSVHEGLITMLAVDRKDVYHLQPLSLEDGYKLMKAICGDILDGHKSEVEALVDTLQRLPLALQLAARLISLQRYGAIGIGLSELLQQMSDARRLLGEKVDRDEEPTTLRAIIDLSTNLLPKEDRLRYAQLGCLAPKPHWFYLDKAAAAWGLKSDAAAEAAARTLLLQGLIEEISDKKISPQRRFWIHAVLNGHAGDMLESWREE